MKVNRIIRTIALSAALGFGVWSLAVTFNAASFSDGDVLSAADLNSLLNNNFDAAETAINELESDVGTLDATVSRLESMADALQNDKLDTSGGTITGRTNVSGAAISTGSGDTETLLSVRNTGETGAAAAFYSSNDSNAGAVTMKQAGTGPVLSLKAAGGGPLISGVSQLAVTLVVDDTGTIRIGDMGSDGSENPTITLNAETGRITNNVGSGIPVAFGYVTIGGSTSSTTSNMSATRTGTGVYDITLDGHNFSYAGYAVNATPIRTNPTIATIDRDGNKLRVRFFDPSGSPVNSPFHVVVHKVGP